MNEILNNLVKSNKFYLSLTAMSLAFTLLLNFYNQISDCSLMFTFLALTLNTISALHGTKKAINSIILSVIIIEQEIIIFLIFSSDVHTCMFLEFILLSGIEKLICINFSKVAFFNKNFVFMIIRKCNFALIKCLFDLLVNF